MCPKGDDPDTIGQASRKITITTGGSTSALSGLFTLHFAGFSTTFDADSDQTSNAICKAFAEALPNVDTLSKYAWPCHERWPANKRCWPYIHELGRAGNVYVFLRLGLDSAGLFDAYVTLY